MNIWIVELEPGVWLADYDGDPGRTLVKQHAKWFQDLDSAFTALTAARTYRPYKNAKIRTSE